MNIRFKAGARNSPLAVAQTNAAFALWQEAVPGVEFELSLQESPGDRDRDTDLRETPADFFTRDLDDAVLNGKIDLAVHSAKDVPDHPRKELDWFWLPWRADPRDVVVLREGDSIESLPSDCRIGISSERREEWARKYYPDAKLESIRGNIESRLEQLDRGDYDMLLMAGAALIRLNIEHRITRWISLDDIPVPEGQGYLCVTYRAGDKRMNAMRSFFMKPARLVGAGPGDAGLLTQAAHHAIQKCNVCLHDALISDAVTDMISPQSRKVNVGKRCGAHFMSQAEISALLADEVRKGYRVVRLKGGDPGLFGRVADEVEKLEESGLPYEVIPGVSSLCAATSGTGLLLTRRGISRGFSVMTPRVAGGESRPVTSEYQQKLPLVLFMGVTRTKEMIEELLQDGRGADEPACMVLSIGLPGEQLVFGTLSTIVEQIPDEAKGMPGLLIIGQVAQENFLYSRTGSALRGARVLVTCSGSLQSKAAAAVEDVGGRALSIPMIRSVRNRDADSRLKDISRYDWVAVTSPSAVDHLMEGLAAADTDVRSLPAVMTCGPGSVDALMKYGVKPDLVAERDFGSEGLINVAERGLMIGRRLLRVKSTVAGNELSSGLRSVGYDVDDVELYCTEPVPYHTLPEFDAVIFTSGSGVRAYMNQVDVNKLRDKAIVAIGAPTELALQSSGITDLIRAREATLESCVQSLASQYVMRMVSEETHR